MGKSIAIYRPSEISFSQGDASDSVLYLQEGAVKQCCRFRARRSSA
jgi:hypothetical protein